MNPFMLAVANGHLEVIKTMIEKDPGLMSFQTASELKIIYWALEKDHCCAFFKVCFLLFINCSKCQLRELIFVVQSA